MTKRPNLSSTDQPVSINATVDDVDDWFRTEAGQPFKPLRPDAWAAIRPKVANRVTLAGMHPRPVTRQIGPQPIRDALQLLRTRIPAAIEHWNEQGASAAAADALAQLYRLQGAIRFLSPDILLESITTDIEIGRHSVVRFLYPTFRDAWITSGREWTGRLNDHSPLGIALSRAAHALGFAISPPGVRNFLEERFADPEDELAP